VQLVGFHSGAAISSDAAKQIFPAIRVEISGQAVVPVDTLEIARVALGKGAVVTVEPQVGWMEMLGDEQIRPAVCFEIGGGRTPGQIRLAGRPAAAALSVTVTETGEIGAGVWAAGGGVGPAPGAAGAGGADAAVWEGSETGPAGELACSMSWLEPRRPTTVIIDPALPVTRPMSSSLPEAASADFTVAHVVPSKCTTSVLVRCSPALQ
jgi:hypothetical protein